MPTSPTFIESAQHASADVSSPARLKVYQYGLGFCVSALSGDAAEEYVDSLLPWTWTVFDSVLLNELPDRELDKKLHFAGNLDGDEWSLTFREELQRHQAHGELEPDTSYDQMHLIPTAPSYDEEGWCLASLFDPVDEQFHWATVNGKVC